jgi:hypothetical protein
MDETVARRVSLLFGGPTNTALILPGEPRRMAANTAGIVSCHFLIWMMRDGVTIFFSCRTSGDRVRQKIAQGPALSSRVMQSASSAGPHIGEIRKTGDRAMARRRR